MADIAKMGPGEVCDEIAGGHLAHVLTRGHRTGLANTNSDLPLRYYRVGLYRKNTTLGIPNLDKGWYWYDFFTEEPVLEADDHTLLWERPTSPAHVSALLYNNDASADNGIKATYTAAAPVRHTLCQLEDAGAMKLFTGRTQMRHRRLKSGSILILKETDAIASVAKCQTACFKERFCHSFAYSEERQHCQLHKAMPKSYGNDLETASGYEWRQWAHGA